MAKKTRYMNRVKSRLCDKSKWEHRSRGGKNVR